MNLRERFPLTQALLHFWQLLDWKLYNIEPMDKVDLAAFCNVIAYISHTSDFRLSFHHIPNYK